MLFRSRRRSATAEPEREPELAEGRSTEELLEEIESLTRENQERPDAETEVRLVELRHAVGIRQLDAAETGRPIPSPPSTGYRTETAISLASGRARLSPEVLRAGILRDGCLLVRGAVDRDAALALAEEIDRAFEPATRPRRATGRGSRSYYSEFMPAPRFRAALSRDWIAGGGGLWAADSPHLLFEMLRRPSSAPDCWRRFAATSASRPDLGAEVHPAAGGSGRGTGLAPGRRLLGRRARAQRLALALALRRRGPRHGRRSAATRRHRPDAGPRARTSTGRSPNRWPRRRRERRGSCGRSSSPVTCCSSTTCSCIPRRRSRRCRRAAGRSRAGSSAPPLRRRNTRRLRPSRAAEPERFFFVHMQKTGGTSLYMRTKRHFGEAGVYPDDSDGDVQDVAPQLMVPVLLERWPKRRDQIRLVARTLPALHARTARRRFHDVHGPAGPGRTDAELPPTSSGAESHRLGFDARGDVRGPGAPPALSALHRQPHGEDALAADRGDDRRDDDAR